jgi:hypothetical protein
LSPWTPTLTSLLSLPSQAQTPLLLRCSFFSPFAADAPAGGLGGDRWKNLKDGAGHLSHEVGAALWVSHGDATDQHVLTPLLTMGARSAEADLTNLLRQWVDDPDDKY